VAESTTDIVSILSAPHDSYDNSCPKIANPKSADKKLGFSRLLRVRTSKWRSPHVWSYGVILRLKSTKIAVFY
jgi:hypothetical protein